MGILGTLRLVVRCSVVLVLLHADGWTGPYTDYLATSTKMLIHKPLQIDWSVAAGIPEVCIFQHPSNGPVLT